MDWFLYDNGLRHERVKYSPPLPHQNFRWFWLPTQSSVELSFS